MSNTQERPVFSICPLNSPEWLERWAIINQHGEYWTGKEFVDEVWKARARLYASPNEAYYDMRNLYEKAYEGKRRIQLVAPIYIDLYTDEETPSLNRLVDWLVRAGRFHLNRDEFGNGPNDDLVLSEICFGEIRRIDPLSD